MAGRSMLREAGPSMKNWGRLADAAMGLAMAGMFFTIFAAAIFGPDDWVTYAVALVFIGPFLVGGVGFCLAFCLSLVLYGDPDELFERWSR